MSVLFDPTILCAVVEHLKSSDHFYVPVDTEPEWDCQYRLICLTINPDKA